MGHASIRIGGAEIMLSDAYPDYGAVAPADGATTATFAVQLFVPDADATSPQRNGRARRCTGRCRRRSTAADGHGAGPVRGALDDRHPRPRSRRRELATAVTASPARGRSPGPRLIARPPRSARSASLRSRAGRAVAHRPCRHTHRGAVTCWAGCGGPARRRHPGAGCDGRAAATSVLHTPGPPRTPGRRITPGGAVVAPGSDQAAAGLARELDRHRPPPAVDQRSAPRRLRSRPQAQQLDLVAGALSSTAGEVELAHRTEHRIQQGPGRPPARRATYRCSPTSRAWAR